MKRKKLVWTLTALFVLTAFSGCGEKKEEDHTANQSKEADVAYISDSEAEIFFYEITSTYRFELMTMDPEQLKAGANPEYWSGIAPEAAELSFDELTDAYINEEERSLLSTAYGSNIANVRFGIYSIAELQKGMDELFGEGKYDVSAWNNGNVDIVSKNIFGTAAGFFLFSKTESLRFDNQIYKVVSVSGGEGTATVKARAVSVDNITDQAAYDLTKTVENDDGNGNTVKSYQKLENANLEGFDYGADFSTNIKAMGINEEELGTAEFVFGFDGRTIYLDHITTE